MFWITQTRKSSRRTRARGHSITDWFNALNERFVLHESVRKERDSLANLSDDQLRDIGLHRAEAERESQRLYFDLPKDRETNED